MACQAPAECQVKWARQAGMVCPRREGHRGTIRGREIRPGEETLASSLESDQRYLIRAFWRGGREWGRGETEKTLA